MSNSGRKAGSAKAQSASHRKYSQRPGGNSPSEDRQIGAFPNGTFHPAGQDSTPWPLASAPNSPRALPRRHTAGPGSVLPGMQRAADLSPNGIRCPAPQNVGITTSPAGAVRSSPRHRTRLLVAARLFPFFRAPSLRRWLVIPFAAETRGMGAAPAGRHGGVHSVELTS